MSRSVLAVAALVALATTPATAHAARPAGLPSSTTTTHVRVHYDTATATAAAAQALAADTEEAYGRLVAGAGGTPNAGLRAPVSDGTLGGDARVDVYMVAPPGGGGQVLPDTSAEHTSGYVLIDPSMSRGAIRFRAAHEFMHVIQLAYTHGIGLYVESTANWAAEFALPDVEALDSSFSVPFLPLDCSYGSWEGTACGSGYRQWPFVWRQVERDGVGFVDRWLAAYDALDLSSGSAAIDRQTLATALAPVTLRAAYADYVWRLWDPTVWTTTAISTMTTTFGDPLAAQVPVSRATPDSTPQNVVVDHLGTRFARVRQGGAAPTGPDDRLRIRVARPAAVAATPAVLVADRADGGRTRVPLTATCDGTPCVTVSADAATVRDVVVVLTNDNETVDDAAFTWRAELLPGTATPPPNDTRAGALDAPLATPVTTDAAYAGGLGEDEAPCDAGAPYTAGATRGVWFRFAAPNTGGYLFDAGATDYRAVVVLLSGDRRLTCTYRPADETGVTAAAALTAGQVVDVYVGRHATSQSPGHTARLTVTGPGAPPPVTTTTTTTTAPPTTTPTTTTTTTTTTATPPDTTAPVLRVAVTTVRASRAGVLRVVLACPATERRCSGTLALPRTRGVALGTRTFAIVGGRRATVQLRFSKAALRMLRRARRVRVTATIRARDAAGNSRTTRMRLTLLAPR